jgi:hypothetical protein
MEEGRRLFLGLRTRKDDPYCGSSKDMTLFHLKRLDNPDGRETLDDIKHGRRLASRCWNLSIRRHFGATRSGPDPR